MKFELMPKLRKKQFDVTKELGAQRLVLEKRQQIFQEKIMFKSR